MQTTVCLGQPSWKIAANRVEACITQQGGHLAPVRFQLPQGAVEPYAVAPWAEEAQDPKLLPLLQSLRGDFFCLPFGGNEKPHRGKCFPPHGETANGLWHFKTLQNDSYGKTLHLSLASELQSGQVEKLIHVRNNEAALYCRHIISGMSGRFPIGHHALLKIPPDADSAIVSTSKMRFAQVLPTSFENPEQGGYSRLKPGAVFSRMDRVPLLSGENADISRHPTGKGFDDLALFVHEARPDFAWTAVTYPRNRYVWFALKDPQVLRSTIFWMSNGGRHYLPWNGRHVRVLGVEDVTSYFHYGAAESARSNSINRQGFATSVELRPNHPYTVNYIMAVAEIPEGFRQVRAIIPDKHHVTLVSTGNHRVNAAVDTAFLYKHVWASAKSYLNMNPPSQLQAA
ncbi:MAG: hypothetical protein ACFUZC_12130 [Chthoniobacteraceae bacterium]